MASTEWNSKYSTPKNGCETKNSLYLFSGPDSQKASPQTTSLDTWLQSTCLEQVNGKPLPAHGCSPGTSNQSTDNVVPSHCLYRTYRPLLELNLVNFVHACLLGLAHVLSVNKTLSE